MLSFMSFIRFHRFNIFLSLRLPPAYLLGLLSLTLSFTPFLAPSLEATLLPFMTALDRAYTADASQNISASEIAMHRGNCIQAGMLKNPEFSVFLEDFDGSLIYGGWDNSQITFTITQEIDMWKKREARVNVARFEEIMAENEAMITRQIVRRELVDRFFTAFALQEKRRISHEKWMNAQESLTRLKCYVAEGKHSPSLLPLEELRVIRLQIEFEGTERLLEHAYHLLALRMGVESPDFHQLEYTFYELKEPLKNVMDFEALQNHPLIARSRASIELSKQRIHLARREFLPSPQVIVGVRQLPGVPSKKRAFAFVAGLTFPLTVWDRNQGAICAAKAQLEGDEARLQMAQVQLRTELTQRHQELMHAYIAASTYKTILQKAQQHYLASSAAFQEGLMPLSNWVEGEQAWFAMQEEAIDRLLHYHQKKEALDSLLELLSIETSLP